MNTHPAPHPSGERFFFAVTAALLLCAACITGALVVNKWLAVVFTVVLVIVLTVGLLTMTSSLLSDEGDED